MEKVLGTLEMALEERKKEEEMTFFLSYTKAKAEMLK